MTEYSVIKVCNDKYLSPNHKYYLYDMHYGILSIADGVYVRQLMHNDQIDNGLDNARIFNFHVNGDMFACLPNELVLAHKRGVFFALWHGDYGGIWEAKETVIVRYVHGVTIGNKHMSQEFMSYPTFMRMLSMYM